MGKKKPTLKLYTSYSGTIITCCCAKFSNTSSPPSSEKGPILYIFIQANYGRMIYSRYQKLELGGIQERKEFCEPSIRSNCSWLEKSRGCSRRMERGILQRNGRQRDGGQRRINIIWSYHSRDTIWIPSVVTTYILGLASVHWQGPTGRAHPRAGCYFGQTKLWLFVLPGYQRYTVNSLPKQPSP